MEYELKKCPFCGGEAEISFHNIPSETIPGELEGTVYGVVCTECSAQSDRYCLSEKEAVEKWNKRIVTDSADV